MPSEAITNFRLGQREAAGAPEALPLADEFALQSAGAAFHALADTMPQMVWSTLPDGSHDYYNARWYEFTGVPVGSTDGEGWAGMFHEEDQPKAWERWRESLATGKPYEVEYRLRHRSGEYRWMLGRALPILSDSGEIQRWIGTCTDIEDQKRAALQNEILSQELSHRIKNIFAIVSGLISLAARANSALGDAAQDLLGRISALGRAHEFVRPHSENSRPQIEATTFHGLLARIFAPYPAFSEGRIEISGPDIAVDSRAATPIALVFHELVTNAMKYGALATADGRIDLDIDAASNDCVSVTWAEQGARLDPSKVSEEGFGSRLLGLSIKQQLGGNFEQTWLNDGLRFKMEIRRDRLEMPTT